MSEVIHVLDNDDMPCNDFPNTNYEGYEDCPMKEKWHEKEIRMCFKCGWLVGYNTDEED